jgi:hypothetical protein
MVEPVSAVFGIVSDDDLLLRRMRTEANAVIQLAALPQCIQSAKQLYDLRSRYKDANILITAIYSESMVIAASLSQVQTLLHQDTLKSKPQLLQTFDRALTGCRVVYGCLEEEVRDLVVKTETDDLKFRDRAKFLWKEDTFKELLTQIRGQQSALSLLIQGLQMESIADIRRLVEENSVTLDHVVKRSRTLRQSHPRVRVPESLFNPARESEDAEYAESILKSTEFTFDDDVINSKAYRRSMALYTTSGKELRVSRRPTPEIGQDEPPAYESSQQDVHEEEKSSATSIALANATASGAEEGFPTPMQIAITEENQSVLESHEKNILPYMPRITSTAPQLSSFRSINYSETTAQSISPQDSIQVRSYSEGNLRPAYEEAPPLPPRRPSGSPSRTSNIRSASFDNSKDASNAQSSFSANSTASSHTTYEPSVHAIVVSRKPLRKPLPLSHQASSDILGTVRSFSSTFESPTSTSPLQNSEMHDTWLSLIEEERKLIDRMTKLRKMFYDNVLRQWPLLEKHLGAILIGEQLAALNKESFLQVMEQQVSESPGAICDPSVVEQWTKKAHKVYREFCQSMPHAVSSLHTTQKMDPKFDPFVNTVGLSLAWFGMGWEDYLKLPLSQLELYTNKLEALIVTAEALDDPAAFHEAARLKRAVEAVHWLKTSSATVLQDAKEREDVQNLEKRIHTLDSDIFSQLRLLDSSRRVRYQGSMAIKLKSQGQWQAVHVILLDNFLLWGRVKAQKKGKGDRIIVLDPPIPIDDLEIAVPCEEHQFQKATMFDDIPRGSVIYIITVRNNSGKMMPHMLGAFGFQERKAWLENFTAATTVHNANT